MANFCNITVKDRVCRIGFGLLILAALLLSWPKQTVILITLIMIAEGIIGWCGLASLVDRYQQKDESP